jgi:hypothetical protein
MMTERKWINYFFGTDFTPVAEALKSIQVDTVLKDDTALGMVALLQEIDKGEGKDSWVTDDVSVQWNLTNVHVCYNGVNTPDLPTNSKYSHVLMLMFPEGSVAPTGKVCLQYNLMEV